MVGIYNRFWGFNHLSDVNEQELVVETEEDVGLTKALDTYRKLIGKDGLTEQQEEELEKELKKFKKETSSKQTRFMKSKKLR